MDDRCPLKLREFPVSPCPLALKRLERLRRLQGNVSHSQESEWKGDCPWAISDKASCFCFFKYVADADNERGHSIIEMAEKTVLTQASIYSALHRAVDYIKRSDVIKVIRGQK